MTLSPLMIYFIGVCDALVFVVTFIFICFLFALLLLPVILAGVEELHELKIEKMTVVKTIVGGLIVSLFLCVLIPDRKTLIAMYVLPPIVNSEAVQELPADILDFVRDYLKEQKND